MLAFHWTIVYLCLVDRVIDFTIKTIWSHALLIVSKMISRRDMMVLAHVWRLFSWSLISSSHLPFWSSKSWGLIFKRRILHRSWRSLLRLIRFCTIKFIKLTMSTQRWILSRSWCCDLHLIKSICDISKIMSFPWGLINYWLRIHRLDRRKHPIRC